MSVFALRKSFYHLILGVTRSLNYIMLLLRFIFIPAMFAFYLCVAFFCILDTSEYSVIFLKSLHPSQLQTVMQTRHTCLEVYSSVTLNMSPY